MIAGDEVRIWFQIHYKREDISRSLNMNFWWISTVLAISAQAGSRKLNESCMSRASGSYSADKQPIESNKLFSCCSETIDLVPTRIHFEFHAWIGLSKGV